MRSSKAGGTIPVAPQRNCDLPKNRALDSFQPRLMPVKGPAQFRRISGRTQQRMDNADRVELIQVEDNQPWRLTCCQNNVIRLPSILAKGRCAARGARCATVGPD